MSESRQDLEAVEEVHSAEASDAYVATVQSFTYSGPLPPPGMLKAYEDLRPGSADEFFRWAEKEQQDRQARLWKEMDLRDKALNKEIEAIRREQKLQARGQYFGMIAVSVLLGIAGTLAFMDFPWQVVALFAIPSIASTIRAFMNN